MDEQPKPPSPQERQAAALEAVADALHRRERRIEREERERREHERYQRGHQSEPKRLDFGLFVQAVPGLAANFSRVIPSEFWSLDGRTATVACPCGEASPETTVGTPHFCDADCGRAYLYDGENVRVAFSPAPGTQEPQTPAAA